MGRYKILLIDDDESLAQVMEYNLVRAGYGVRIATSGEEGVDLFRAGAYPLVICDIKLPGMDGLKVLQRLREIAPEVTVIIITAFGSIEKAVQAMKLGACDYITKPFNKDEFIITVKNALERYALREENRRLRNELGARFQRGRIITVSPKMLKTMEIAEKVADSKAGVLIYGESGTGKELLARYLHLCSDRADRPFVTINCAAIPRDLLESELFGYVKGAFTGANKDKKGKFELADGGTVFLDEIGELPLELQKKLLRVLQEEEIDPVGAEGPRSIDVRVIAAGNRDLKELAAAGHFREDLYYRINVIPLTVPSLRERPEDIPPLVRHFLKKEAPGRELRLAPGVMESLKGYAWKGNVRELENLCKRLVLLCEGDLIRPDDLPREMLPAAGAAKGLPFDLPPDGLSLEELERCVIIEALRKHDWNQSRTAQYLRIPRHVLIYRLEKYDIRKDAPHL